MKYIIVYKEFIKNLKKGNMIRCKYKSIILEDLSELNKTTQIISINLKRKTAISYDYFKEEYEVEI